MANYLLNAWYVAAFADELTDKLFSRKLLDTPVVLFRDQSGAPRALADRCPHRFAPLHLGRLENGQVSCAYHGLRFNGEGSCVFNPHGNGAIPPKANVRAYPIVEKHRYLWIWMGDPALADVALIPDFNVIDDPSFAFFHSYLNIASDYQLISDNLLDLSHIQFLHPFLGTPEWVANSFTKARREGNTAYGTSRSKVDIPVFPVWRLIKPDVTPIGTPWMDSRWDAPANIYLDIRLVTSKETLRAPNGHFMTPETDGRTHYFFCVGINHRIDDSELLQKLEAKVSHAFAHEDEPIIAAQQTNVGNNELLALGPVILQSDAVAILARRVLSQMMAAEMKGRDSAESRPAAVAAPA